jgi:lysophospholipase L1-like esterase/tetratricopeptide (TPR) repeat protein
VVNHWKTALLMLVLIPSLFELFLQSVSIMSVPLLKIGEKLTGHRPVVLCVGDSFTAGQFGGAHIRPYFDYLEGILSKQQPKKGWSVLHFGSEFLDSEATLDQLPGLLQKQRPDVVYIMIGVNDMFMPQSSEEELSSLHEASVAARPQWLRSAILFQLVKKHPSPGSLLQLFSVPPAFILKKPIAVDYPNRLNAFSGSFKNLLNRSAAPVHFPTNAQWYYRGRPASFTTNGIVDRDETKQNYQVRGNLYLQGSGQGKNAFLWETNGDTLLLIGQNIAESFPFTKRLKVSAELAARSQSEQILGWKSLEDGALKAALRHFTDAINADPENAFSHAGLAETYFRSNSDRETKKEIAWLQKKYQTDPDPVNARALIHAFPFENPPPDVFKMALSVVKDYPENPWYWQTLSWNAFLSNRPDMAEKSIARALALAPPEMSRLRASLFRMQALVVVESKPDAALQSLFSAFVLDHDENQIIEDLQLDASLYLHANLQKCLNAVSPNARFKLTSLFHLALDDRAAVSLLVFEKRLAAIVQLCQEYSARPVLLSYPVRYAGLDEITQRVAKSNGVPLINVQERMEMIRKNEKRQYQSNFRFTEQDSQRLAEWIANDIQQRKLR